MRRNDKATKKAIPPNVTRNSSCAGGQSSDDSGGRMGMMAPSMVATAAMAALPIIVNRLRSIRPPT